MRRLIRPILLLLALALTGCGKDNPVTPGPPDLPLPTYYSVETGVDNGFVFLAQCRRPRLYIVLVRGVVLVRAQRKRTGGRRDVLA